MIRQTSDIGESKSGGVDTIRLGADRGRGSALPYDRFGMLHGWGRSSSSPSWVYRPSTPEAIASLFAETSGSGVSIGFRGAGRSYGDAPLNAENILLDLTRMRRILSWNPASGEITVEPGVTIGDLWQYVIEDGWWPPVVPGTMFPTVGGCAAMNVHGKNCYRVGPIGDHIRSFSIMTPAGEHLRCSRQENRSLFYAAIGGFGMLGCFTSVTLQMKRVDSGLLSVRPYCVPDLAGMIRLFEQEEADADYLVGWIDAFAGGKNTGRGVVHAARYLEASGDPSPGQTLRAEYQALPETILRFLPKSMLWRLMRPMTNDLGVRLLNTAKYRASRMLDRGQPYRQSHAAFAFLLDYVPGWKRAYGPGGLVQYQSFVPSATALDVFPRLLSIARRHSQIPYLAVFKKHRPDDFLITHGLDGYSLALDFRVDRSFRRVVDRMAREMTAAVLEGGGRFYFAKDSLLRPEEARAFLGEETIGRLAELKRQHDPSGLLESDLARRLFPADQRRRPGGEG